MKNIRTILFSMLVFALAMNVSSAQNYKSQFNVKSTGHVENDKQI